MAINEFVYITYLIFITKICMRRPADRAWRAIIIALVCFITTVTVSVTPHLHGTDMIRHVVLDDMCHVLLYNAALGLRKHTCGSWHWLGCMRTTAPSLEVGIEREHAAPHHMSTTFLHHTAMETHPSSAFSAITPALAYSPTRFSKKFVFPSSEIISIQLHSTSARQAHETVHRRG